MTNRWTSRNCDSGNAGGNNRKQNEDDDELLEVLLELQEHKNIIKSKRSQLLDKITENVISITGQSDVQVHTLRSSRKASSSLRVKQKKRYLLQRYVNEWKAYVNCDSTDQVKNRDWLTVTVQPGSSSSPTLAPQNEPTKATTAVKPNHSRSTAVTVFLLKNFMSGTKVPKNAVRRQMLQEERCKTLYLTRDDNPKHVEEIIKSTFDLESYTILDCDKRCNLFVSPLKTISGKQAIERRKALYLCEEVVDHEEMAEIQLSDTGSTSTSEVDETDSNTDHGHHLISLPHRSRPSKSKGKQLKVPDNISDISDQRKGKLAVFDHEEFDSDSSLDQYLTSLPHKTPKRKRRKVSHNIMNNYDGPSSSGLSFKKGNLVEPIVVIDSCDEEKQELTMNSKGVSDWHALRLMQDEEYEISVRVDKEKQKIKEAELMRKELQEKLSDKWLNNLNTCTTEGLKLSLRLPNSQKLDCSLSRNSSTKTIYEIAFGVGGISKPFKVYTIRPRRFISMNSTVNELSFPQTLVIEEDEDATDPVVFLSQDTSQPDHDIKLIRNSRETLHVKHNESKSAAGPILITFRLPNGSIVKHGFYQTDVTKELYEYVFCNSYTSNHGFKIFKVIPREEIPCSETITLQQLNMEESCVVTIQFSDNDILKLLNIEPQQEKSICVQSEELDSLDALEPAVAKRIDFINSMDTHFSQTHVIKRSNIYEDLMVLFENEDVLSEYPLCISFADELGVDAGGVCRDLFSAFWEIAYKRFFDGDSLLVPMLHPGVDMAALPQLGKIISHGYLVSGFLPTRIIFPALACILLGVTVEIPSHIVVESFAASLSSFDASTVKEALRCKDENFTHGMQSKLLYIFSQYGCRVCPKPLELRRQIESIAKCALLAKPMAALCAISSGVTLAERPFWQSYSAEDLYTLYMTLTATPGKVLSIIEEPIEANPSEMQTFAYLRQYIGNMRKEDVPRFLRFCTGSSVIISKAISIAFNGSSGCGRTPIAYTCSSTLVLPTTYISYLDFEHEFNAILADDEYSWQMLNI